MRTYRLTPESLDEVAAWLGAQRDLWSRRLDQLDTHLESLQRAAKERPQR